MSDSSEFPFQVAEQPVAQPTLRTERLLLRPFRKEDAAQVQSLLQSREIAANTRSIDHPYPEGAAETWIGTHLNNWNTGAAAVFCICSAEQQETVIGAIGIELDHSNEHAELGYWIGEPFWGRGFCSEAAVRLLRFGFEHFGLHRIHAHHLTRNPASGRVLQKIGMKNEGLLRGHFKKWGVFEDIEFYGILARELDSGATANEN